MSRTLERQLRRLNLDPQKVPENLEDWAAFLKVIEETYEQNAQDRYLLERSLEISSREMSERIVKNKELSLQLVQASKLGSLGTLASGIAHELNNPLQAIKGYTEVLIRKEADRATALGHLDRINRLTNRMVGTIKHLLKLSRKSHGEPKTRILVTEPIKEAHDLLGKQLLYDKIHFELVSNCHRPPVILGDMNQLFGVFQNLLSNSRDAFKTVKEERPFWIKVEIDETSDQIMVSFKDNAGGIPAHVLPRIFDPFFTTKEVGTGTGLGLALSRQTIEELGGLLRVEVQGVETTFTISFPLAELGEDKENSGSIAGVPNMRSYNLPKQNLEVLIVDDEEDIGDLLEMQFSQIMSVTKVRSGLEAQKKLDEGSFDLLITDIRMPAISGIEVAKYARSNNPEIKLVLISGHIDDDLPEEIKELDPFLFVAKPFESVAAFFDCVTAFVYDPFEKTDS